MAFPVDILTNVDHESLELAAEEYMSRFTSRIHETAEFLSLPDSKQIEIGPCNVSFVPLYGTDTKKKLLALLSPDDFTTVVGLYLLGQWWAVEDVLKTAEPSRTGLIKVSTLGERIVLYVLNRIVLRNEKSSEEVYFLCHCEHESAKILWEDGKAIGFYSYKPKGSLCRDFLTQRYELPVMDTVFVRKCHRAKGHGVKILEDFVGSFRKELIGLKLPLSEAMYKVCEKYFSIYPADKEILWEVEKTGNYYQRTLIAERLQKLKLKEKDQVVTKLNFEEDDVTAPLEIEITKIHETTEYTVEILEETITDITKEVDDIPVTRRGRGSDLKRRGIRENSEERLSKNIIRVEDIEAGVESPIEVATDEHLDKTVSIKESETLGSTTETVTATVTNVSELRSSQKEEERELEKDTVTATSDGTQITDLTTAWQIKSQGGSKEECEMVNKEHTVVIQGATLGSIDQSQLQSVVAVEIVKMSTGTEEEQNENLEKNNEVEEDKPVCEAENEEIKQILDEPEEEKAVSGTVETYNIAADAKITPEQSTGYKEQEGEPELETTEVDLLSQDEKPEEKTDTEQAKEDAQNSNEAEKLIPKQRKHTQKKVSTNTKSLRDQPVDLGVTVRCLRGISKPINITPVRRSTRSKAVIQQVGSVEPKVEAKFSTDENPERDEVIAEEADPEESGKANTSVDETVVIETESSELVKATEIDDKEKIPQITEGTKEDIPLVEAEPDEDVTEKVENIKKMENKGANLARQPDSGIEMSSLAQEKEEEEPVRAERSLRRRATRVQSPLRRKSRRVQKQEPEGDVEHQERQIVVKSKTESSSMPEETVEEMDQEVNKMENKEANLAELEPVEEDTEKIIPLVEGEPDEDAIEKGFEEINEMEDEEINIDELEPVEEPNIIRSEDEKTLISTEETMNVCLPIITTETSFESLDDMETVETAAVDTEKSELLMGVEDQEKEAEPDEGTGIEDGSPVIKLQKATVVLVDLNKLSQNTEEEVETPEFSKHSQMEEHLELDKPDKREQELRNLASEEGEQKEGRQMQEDTEMIPEEEKIEEEKSTAEEQNKLDEQDMTFEEQKPTDLTTMPAQSNLVESNNNENNRNENEFVEAEPEEDVVEKEAGNKKTNLAVTKDTVEETPEMEEEANLEQQKNEPLVKNERETAETEKPMGMNPVVNKEQTYVIAETAIQIEEKVSRVESTETNQSDNARITRRSLRLSAKSVTESTLKTRKSTRLHKEELEPVKKADMNGNKFVETSATTKRNVNVCIPIITVETNLKSPAEIPNTNVEKTSGVETETSELLMGVETDDKKEAPKILEEVTLVESEPDEQAEKDDGTPIIQLQKATVVLVDLNLYQNTEGECDTPEVLTHSQIEEQLELDEPDKNENQLHIQTSEHEKQKEKEFTEKTPEEEENKIEQENTVEEQHKLDKQDKTFEEQKPTEDLKGQNDVKETEIVEEYKPVIDDDVEEAATSKEHLEATTMADKTIQEADIALQEKQTDSNVGFSRHTQEEEAVQEILEEEVPVSTVRSLRRRTIRVQSPPRRKSRRAQKQEAEADVEHQERHTVSKTESTSMTEETVEEMDQEVNKMEKEANLAELEPVEEDTEKIIPLVEGEPDEEVIEKGFVEIKKMESKETSLDNDAAPEMGGEDINLEQHENEPLDKNEKETAGTENPMEMVKVPVCKEQSYVIEQTAIQVEEKVKQVECSETNENKSEGITRRSLRISAQTVTSTQKTRKSTRLHTAELEAAKEADISGNEDTSSTTKNVCVPIITVDTTVENVNEVGDTVSMVDEGLPDKSTDVEEDETKSSIKTTENEILVEMDKTQKIVEGGVQDKEKVEPPQENTGQKLKENIQENEKTSSVEEDVAQQDAALSKEENVGETNRTDELKKTAVEVKVVLDSLDQEAPFITRRSLRHRTVTVQSTPRRKAKRLHRQEVESEKETMDNICGNENHSAIQESADDLNIPVEKENKELNAEESIAESENLKTKEGEGIIQVNIEEKAEETRTKDDTVEEEKEILFEINESNSASLESTEQNKTGEENLERDVQVPKEQEDEVSSVQEEEKPLQEKENEEAVQGSSFGLEETAVERRTLRKRQTVKIAAPRTSKRLRKQEHDEDSEQVKEAVMEQIDTVEVTFTADNVELSSDVPAAVFEGSNLGGEIQQKIQENAEGTKSDGDCNIPAEIPNTNAEKTSGVEIETSELLMGVDTDDKKEAPKILEEVTLVESEPDEQAEKDDGTPIIQPQKATVVLVDLNLYQNTEGGCDTPEVLTHSQIEEQLELDEPDKNENQLHIQASEHEEQKEEEFTEKTPEEEENKIEEENTVEEQHKLDKQDKTFEEQKPTEDLKGQNDVKETEIVEEYKLVIDDDLEEAATSKEHLEATTMADKTIQEADIALQEKQTDSDVGFSGHTQEEEAVQEILEEEVPVSTVRSLRRRTIRVQSPPRRKSRHVQKQEAEADVEHQERHTASKTESTSMTEETVEEMDQEVNKMEKEANLAELEPVEEDTEKIIPLVEGEPDEEVIEKGFVEIKKMESKETSLDNDVAPEMGGEDINLEQHENEPLDKNEKETAETENPMEMVEVPVCKEQSYVIEQTAIQVEEKVKQVECSETNENKSEGIIRRSLRISAQTVTSTQKTRKSTRLHTAELEAAKEADISGYEETSSTTKNVCVPIITVDTTVENVNEVGDTVSMVDEGLPDKSTDVEEDETKSSIKTTENEILVEMDKTQKNVEGGVQDKEKVEPPQENTGQKLKENIQENEKTSSVEEDVAQQDAALSKEENVGETNPTDELKKTAVEGKVVLDSLDQEAPFITRRSLRHRTVTVQCTPRRKAKRLHRQEVESEKETTDNICGNENHSAIQESADDLNIPVEKENKELNTEESIAESENLKTKEGEGIIQVNIEGKAEETRTKDDTVEEEKEILFEINESNSASLESTEQNKTGEENLERDVQVPKEQEDEVSSVQEEEKPLQEKENEEAVQGSSFGLEETAVERRTLRKRQTVKIAAPRTSKRLRKQEHDEDSEQVKEAVMEQIETVEVTFTADNVELSSDVPAAVFEGSNLGGEKQQKIQENAEGTKSDVDCNIPAEIPNTNAEKTSGVETVTSELLMGVDTDDKKEAPKILEEVTLVESEPDEQAEKDDGTPIIQLQKATVVLVDLNLYQNTEGECDTPEVLTHSQIEEQLELDEPDKNENQLHIQTSEHEEQKEEEFTEKTPEEEENKIEQENTVEEQHKLDKQDKTFEEQKPIEDLKGQNDVKETEIVEEYKLVIDDDLEEAVTSKEHLESTTMADKTIQEADIALQEKQTDSDVGFSGHTQEEEAVQEILEEEVPVSTVRSLRRRTIIRVQSPPRRKSRRVQKQEAEADAEHQERHTVSKTESTSVTEETVEEMDQDVNKMEKEANLAELEPVEEDTEKIIPLVEGEPDEDVIKKGFVEIKKMESKETSLDNDAAPEMGEEDINLEQHENEPLDKNEKETAETENPMEMVVELSSDVPAAVFEDSNLGGEIQQKIQENAEGTKSDGDCNIHVDTKRDAGESQEEQKEKRVNKPQTDEDNEEVIEQNSKRAEQTSEMEEVIELHVETEEEKLEPSINEGFNLELEVGEASDQEVNKAGEESRVAIKAPKDIFTSAEKSDEGDENISDEDEKGLAIEKHDLQSSSSTSSSRRRSMRLQMQEPKKNTKEDESASDESEVQQTAKQRDLRKRKAITDLTPVRRSKRYVRERIA